MGQHFHLIYLHKVDFATNGKVTTSQFNITNESQELRPFPAGDHKATINRLARKHKEN